MPDLIVHDLAEETLHRLQRRAQQNSRSVDAEAAAILDDAMLREKYTAIVKEQGFGRALAAIGREFDIDSEFDDLRQRQLPPGP